MAQLLSDRDAARLQAMLRWFDDHVDIQYPRRRHKSRGGGGGGYGVLVGWFKLSDVGSDPMTGKLQTCAAGSFSDASGAENKSIYIHPGSALANYAVNDYVFANYVGNSWVSVNIFSSDDEVDDAIVNILNVCA